VTRSSAHWQPGPSSADPPARSSHLGERHDPEFPDIPLVVSRQWLDMVAKGWHATYDLGEQKPDGTFEPTFRRTD